MAVLVVEQKVREVLKIAHRVYVLRNGLTVFSGSTHALDDAELRRVYL
jgi:ABC-type branched-subunit amino acid transport system ATPase component